MWEHENHCKLTPNEHKTNGCGESKMMRSSGNCKAFTQQSQGGSESMQAIKLVLALATHMMLAFRVPKRHSQCTGGVDHRHDSL
jgi:hypothetical protein